MTKKVEPGKKAEEGTPPPPKRYLAQDQKRFLAKEIDALAYNIRAHLVGELVENAAARLLEEKQQAYKRATKDCSRGIAEVKFLAGKLKTLVGVLEKQAGLEVAVMTVKGGRAFLNGEIEVIEPEHYSLTRKLKEIGRERLFQAEKELRVIKGKVYLTPQEDGFKLLEQAQAVVDKYCAATTDKKGLRKLKRLPDEEDE